MSQIKTIALTGGETKVNFDKMCAYVFCNNLTDSEVLLSTKSDFTRGDDDVVIINSSCSAGVGDIGVPQIQTVYLKGNGEVQICGKGSGENPFKRTAKGGEGNGLLNVYGIFGYVAEPIYSVGEIIAEEG